MDNLTRSGTGGGIGGVETIRRNEMDSNDTRIVNNVEDLVFVIESILDRTKLKNATNGSRCCTSARRAKRMSWSQISIFLGYKEEEIRYNCSRTRRQKAHFLRSRA